MNRQNIHKLVKKNLRVRADKLSEALNAIHKVRDKSPAVEETWNPFEQFRRRPLVPAEDDSSPIINSRK